MSESTTPRRFIQVELNPSGEETGAKVIDFELIDHVEITRKPVGDDLHTITGVMIFYKGLINPGHHVPIYRNILGLKDEGARFFHDEWMKYLESKGQMGAKAEPAKPGVIHIAQSTPQIHIR
jgi:hypothetical protein